MHIPHISLDKNSDIPLYRQLSDAIKEAVAQGKIAPDTKLPSIRQMARTLDVNNTTIVSAYKNLEREAAVYTIVGSGTFIAQPELVVEAPSPPKVEAGFINFADTSTDMKLFPVTAFRRAFDAVLDRDGGNAFDCHDNQGYKPLRESLCQLLNSYGVKTEPDCMQVIPDAQQGLKYLTDAFIEPGDIVLAEKLTSQRAVAAFLSKRAQVIDIPLTQDGPDMEALETLIKKHKPKLIYVTPHFQTPTGISYSIEKQHRLLELVKNADTYIIEEDQYSDFYYDGIKRTPLKALDTSGKVFYIKSFSKTLVPGLRMGFMVCPKGAIAVGDDITASGYIQRGLDLFLRSGAYELHVANMRSIYGRRYNKIVAAVNTYLGHLADFKLPGGGLSLWVTPHTSQSDDDYSASILQRQVVVSPGWLYSTAKENGFMISFAAVADDKIAEGIGVIASVLGGEGHVI
ncbi:MAG: PLP-dependent aminotransferase family protein [Defluviitaleaceae bacterium]|nr:PLP-dependent aminotransferase family protein [Defluviitaleaceae bacterium]